MNSELGMRLSAMFGTPVVDLPEKAERLSSEIYDMVKSKIENPREAVFLMAFAYMYVIYMGVKEKDSFVEVAKETLDAAVMLMEMLDE